jgi:Tfp pilus assembly protein PilV
MIRASTMVEVLIAMLIFISVASISFYIILNVQNSSNIKYDVLKYENYINTYKLNEVSTLDKAISVKVEDELYPYSNEFILRKYSLISDKNEVIYVKHELIEINVEEN